MPHGITQCRGDIPALTPAEAGTRLSDPRGTQGCVDQLCDPMWDVSSRSGVATLRTAIHLLLTYLLTYL